MRAIVSATSVMRCLCAAQHLGDAAGGAPRRFFRDAPEALAQAEEIGGKRRDLLLRLGKPLGQKLGGALRRLLRALAHGIGDAGDALLGRAERVGEERGEAVQARFHRFRLLRKPGGDRLQRLAPLPKPGLHQLVRRRKLRVDPGERFRLFAELRRHRGDVAQHVGRDFAQRLYLIGKQLVRLAGIGGRGGERRAQRRDLLRQRGLDAGQLLRGVAEHGLQRRVGGLQPSRPCPALPCGRDGWCPPSPP